MSKSTQQKMFEGIIRWQQSGLSQKAWCEQNNVAYSSFHYWYRRFRNQQPVDKHRKGDRFVPLLVHEQPSGNPWCEVLLDNGHKLFFHQPVPVEFIRSILE